MATQRIEAPPQSKPVVVCADLSLLIRSRIHMPEKKARVTAAFSRRMEDPNNARLTFLEVNTRANKILHALRSSRALIQHYFAGKHIPCRGVEEIVSGFNHFEFEVHILSFGIATAGVCSTDARKVTGTKI